MSGTVIVGIILALFLLLLFIYCGIVVAAREDEAMKKLFEEMEEKRKGKK